MVQKSILTLDIQKMVQMFRILVIKLGQEVEKKPYVGIY
ncbi:UNVERIFIED_ORG: hypothetical protein ABRZ91_002518 [Heyndrickxia coagulans]